ncbi:MAG: HPr family phosphocarrier protein [Planctomycetes bacterium]|nr:HPr family phosphocarrier protein [Planctomycetota bacterium]
MTEKTIRLANKYGLHMRPAQGLMQLALMQPCDVFVEKNGHRANAKSIIELISLAAEGGEEIRVVCDGDGEEEGLSILAEHIEKMPEIYEEERI